VSVRLPISVEKSHRAMFPASFNAFRATKGWNTAALKTLKTRENTVFMIDLPRDATPLCR
jgi:hypothetical protein